MTDKHSITGRDGYIAAKALYWALKFSQSQPDSIRELSDEKDMKAILSGRYPQFAAGFKFEDELALMFMGDAAGAGDRSSDKGRAIAYFSPPDFTQEDELSVVNHKRNSAALAQTAKDTIEAFRAPKLNTKLFGSVA